MIATGNKWLLDPKTTIANVVPWSPHRKKLEGNNHS